jgi:AcrR family transcriptional regulator
VQRDVRILLAAQQLFYDRGFEAVGVDDIGAMAGITGPAIYRHFASKQALLETLFDHAIDVLLQRTGKACEDPWQEIEAIVQAHAMFVVENPQLAAICQREDRSLSDARRRRWLRRRAVYVELWVNCLKRCFPNRAEADLVSATWAALNQLNSVGTWPHDARRTRRLAELLTTLTLSGLRGLAQTDQVLAIPSLLPLRAGRGSQTVE